MNPLNTSPPDELVLHTIMSFGKFNLEDSLPEDYNIGEQSITDYLNKKLSSEQGCNYLWRFPKELKQFKNPESVIVSEICEKYLSVNEKIIEIGAGELKNKLSYLMQRTPPYLHTVIEPTEVNNFIVQNDSGLKRVDICKMDQTYSPSSINKILGSSTLDCLSNNDLQVACDQIHTVLKPGGLLIHFLHLMPNQNTILNSCNDDSSIYIPWEDLENFKGFYKTQKDKLLEFVSNNNKISNFARIFFTWYSNLIARQREGILLHFSEDVVTCQEFSKWIEYINPSGLEAIDNMDFFEKRIKTALTVANFEILEFGSHYANSIRDRSENDDEKKNYFTWEFGKRKNEKIYVLRTDKVCDAVKMHVIVAQKKED